MVFDLFAMSNLGSSTTGVAGAVLWVSSGDPSGDHHHVGPRLWVVLGDTINPKALADAVIVKLTDPPDVLGTLPPEVAGQVTRFIEANLVVLLDYWDTAISTREMLDLLKRVTP